MAESIIMPKTGMAMEEGVIIEWLKKEGDQIKEGDIIAQIETDKSTMDLESDLSGTLLKLVYPEGTTVPVTLPIAWIGKKGDAIPENTETSSSVESVEAVESVGEKAATEQIPHTSQATASTGKIPSTPAAKRVASEKGIDLATVTPSGKRGEILEKDVLASAPRITPLAARMAEDRQVDISQISGSGHAGKIFSRDLANTVPVADTRVPLTNIQKITGKRMLESVLSIPTVSEDIKADMTRLLELKQSIFEESGVKASVNDFIIKAAAIALRKHPRMNSVFDTDALIFKNEVHIGMAVATERGLLVPVLRNADSFTLSALSEKTKEIIQKARDSKLSPDELTGSTFSISNVGMYGITSFTPIINPPEAGILGVCAIEKLPRFVNGSLVERSIMTLSLSFDHRVVDGAESAQFLQTLVNLLENPLQLLV